MPYRSGRGPPEKLPHLLAIERWYKFGFASHTGHPAAQDHRVLLQFDRMLLHRQGAKSQLVYGRKIEPTWFSRSYHTRSPIFSRPQAAPHAGVNPDLSPAPGARRKPFRINDLRPNNYFCSKPSNSAIIDLERPESKSGGTGVNRVSAQFRKGLMAGKGRRKSSPQLRRER